MKTSIKTKFAEDLLNILCVVLILILASLIGLIAYCWIRYSNLPPDEVPSWVHWLMWRR